MPLTSLSALNGVNISFIGTICLVSKPLCVRIKIMIKDLKVGQINIVNSNIRQHVILNSLSSFNFHIICIQDYWMDEIRLPISFHTSTPPTFGTVVHPSWEVFHPPSVPSSLPHVCIYVRKDIVALFSFSPIIFTSPHMYLLKFISRSHLPSFNIFNVYCLPGAGPNSCFRELLDFNIPISPTLIVGDFNLQHPSWGSPISKMTSKANNLCLYFASYDLFCINVLGVITHISPNSSYSSSIIDLSLFNAALSDLVSFFKWEAHSDFGFNSSDHLFIEINISLPSINPLSTQSSPSDHFSFQSINRKVWSEHFDKFSSSLIFSPLSSCSDIDSLCTILHNCFLSTFSSIQSSILEKRRSNTSSHSFSSLYFKKNKWWSPQLQNAHNFLSSISPSDPSYSQYQVAYKYLVLQNKKDHFKKIIENCSENNIWSLRSWCTKSRKNSFLPSINFRSGPAILPSDYAQGFTQEFFSTSLHFHSYSSLFLDSSPLTPRDFVPISLNEIQAALSPTSNSSSPGFFQILYKFIKFSFPSISSFLLSLFNSILDFSYHPFLWRKALMVVIPKPNKNDYSSSRSYRPISLLECFSKLLEKVIAT